MRFSSVVQGIVGLGLVVAAASCMRAPTGALAPSASELASARYRVAYEIAAARCDRRTPECDTRTGVHYASRDACIEAKLPASAREADLDLCASYNIRDAELNTCITQIRAGECGTGVKGATACRGKSLCPWDSSEVIY